MPDVIIYNSSIEKTGYLENAFEISYEKRINTLWTASFSLPADDPKNSLCSIRYYAEIYDNDERVDLFRIINKSESKDFESNNIITYECEHVLATLIDDVMFQYHQTDNQTTTYNINLVLGHQTTERWTLGTCSFSYQYSYLWESENLLGALFAIPKPFSDEYMWTWDTSSYPWTLNIVTLTAIDAGTTYDYEYLISSDGEPVLTSEGEHVLVVGDSCQVTNIQIRYAKNLKTVETITESIKKCTRIYPLGSGEGINQTTVEDVDETDSPAGTFYIDATPGGSDPICQIWTDTSITDEDTLYATAKALLNVLNTDRVVYSLEAADIYSITGSDVDKLILGDYVTVFDDVGHLVASRVVAISKPDLTGAPGEMSIEIANMAEDLADDFSQLAARAKIASTYAQGSTNMYQVSMAENCDASYPLNIRIVIPDDVARVNQIKLWLNLKPYRSYHKETPQDHTHSLGLWEAGDGFDTNVYVMGISDRGASNVLVASPGTPSSTISASTQISTVTYQIQEQSLSSPSVDVYVGTDTQLGSDNSTPDTGYKVGTYTTDQTGVDITTSIPAAGDIYCIRIIPDQTLRIEATIHARVFILSNPLS